VPNLQEEEPQYSPKHNEWAKADSHSNFEKEFLDLFSKFLNLTAKLQGLKYKIEKIPANSKIYLCHNIERRTPFCGFSGLDGGPLCVRRRRCREIASNRQGQETPTASFPNKSIQHQVQSFHMP
jgi:hypothetical protein